MMISPMQSMIQTPMQSPVQSPTQSPVQSDPVQSAPTPTFNVPKGQLDRTRGNLPQGWSNAGGHNGFKAATITQVEAGYHLIPVNRADMPRGRQ